MNTFPVYLESIPLDKLLHFLQAEWKILLSSLPFEKSQNIDGRGLEPHSPSGAVKFRVREIYTPPGAALQIAQEG